MKTEDHPVIAYPHCSALQHRRFAQSLPDVGVMIAPPLTGAITGWFGFGSYPVMLAILYALMIGSLLILIGQLKKQKRYDNTL